MNATLHRCPACGTVTPRSLCPKPRCFGETDALLASQAAAYVEGGVRALLPRHGSVVIFSRVPHGSWASVGEACRVEVEGRDVWLRSVGRGSGTFDRDLAYRSAVWSEV